MAKSKNNKDWQKLFDLNPNLFMRTLRKTRKVKTKKLLERLNPLKKRRK